MTKSRILPAALALVIFVIGSLQAWDSDVPAAGLLIVCLVSLAIALPPVALLIPMQPPLLLGVFVLAFLLLLVARLISPIPLPGLFLMLVPAVMGLIFASRMRPGVEDRDAARPPASDHP